MPSPPRSPGWETDRVQLSKHHGLANDFLVVLDEVNGRALQVDAELARRVCDRRTGIGADGLIHGAEAPAGSDATVVMHLYNADGGRAETSGNGIRCLGHAVALAREVTDLHVDVRTDAGLRRVVVREADPVGRSAFVEAHMGKVVPGPEVPPQVAARLAEAGPGHATRFATADIGNPHLVVEVDDPGAIDLSEVGAWIEQQFADGINVEFAAPARPAEDRLTMRVWERGAGITEACGSGACATAAVFHSWGWRPGGGGRATGAEGDPIRVAMPGGDALVTLTDGDAVLAGLVHHIATIELPDG
jgi:diaminopimelate epimerase